MFRFLWGDCCLETADALCFCFEAVQALEILNSDTKEVESSEVCLGVVTVPSVWICRYCTCISFHSLTKLQT
jgi:hypothetical protein